MNKSQLKIGTSAIVAVMAMSTAHVAVAQETDSAPRAQDSGQSNVIVVTAQRREQNQQDVPIAITTLSSETLAKTGTDNLEDLTALTPGLSGKNEGVATSIYSIRGINSNSIGVGGENSVGIFVDDVFIGRQALSGIGFLDPERIEVLKGPQGTLFGRNSTAGAISIVSKKPGDFFEGDARIQVSDLDSIELFGGLSVPIVEDKLSIRVAGLYREEDGTWFDVAQDRRVGDSELAAGRIAALWRVTDTFTIEGFYSIWREDTTGFIWGNTDPALVALAPGSSADPFDRRVAHNVPGVEKRDADVAGLTLTYDISDNVTIKSITSYTKLDDLGITDLDATILPLFQTTFGPDPDLEAAIPGLAAASPQETFGQEIRLSGSTDRVDWLLGASYFGETIADPITLQFDETLIVGGTPFPADALFPGSPAFAVCDATSDALFMLPCNPVVRESALQEGNYDSFAVYGDVRYEITDALTATVGLRLSYDKKEFTYTTFIQPSVAGILSGGTVVFPDTGGAPVTLEESWTDLQPRFVLDYRWNDSFLTYASVSRGFKSGGFDISLSAADIPFDEESVWAYELGFKSDLAGGDVILNAAAYYNDYQGFQVQTIVSGITQTVNVPTLDNLGFEVEMLARPSDNFDLNIGVAFNDSEFGTFVTDAGDLTGNRIPVTSKWTLNASSEFRQDLGLNLQAYIRGDVSYRSSIFETIENVDVFSTDGYWLVNGRLGLKNPDSIWDVSLFVQNLFDEEYLTYNNTLGFGNVQRAGMPREIGIEVRSSF